jgi:ankyrin repeat protein
MESLNDDVLLTTLSNLSPRDALSFIKALSPAVKDSVMTTLRESRRKSDMETYVNIYRAKFDFENNLEAVQEAIRRGHRDVYEKIGKLDPETCGVALNDAIDNGDMEHAALLVSIGADLDVDDGAINYAVMSGNIDMVRLLLETAGYFTSSSSLLDQYAIQSAALYGYADIVRLLLEAGSSLDADIDRPEGGGTVPLLVYALGYTDSRGRYKRSYARNPDTSLEIVRLLLEADVDGVLRKEEAINIASRDGLESIAQVLRESLH